MFLNISALTKKMSAMVTLNHQILARMVQMKIFLFARIGIATKQEITFSSAMMGRGKNDL